MPNRAFPYDPKYREAFNRVRSRVYRGGDPVRDDENLLPEDCSATLVERDGQIVGAATSIHYHCAFGDSILKSAGVAAVGVLPEARRTGAASELMRGVNRQMRDEGCALALLYPYSAGFYRQFGYEYAGNRLTIQCPSARLPKVEGGLSVREIEPADSASIRDCYDAFARQYRGMNLRNDDQWDRALGMESPFTIFAAGDPIEAYALIRLDGTFWVDQSVREFAWSTPRGYNSMLSFFKGLAANKNAVSWFEPSESPWLMQYGERDVTVTANQQIMWRVLDVSRALATLRSAAPAEFTLSVIDAEFAENRGPWRVSAAIDGCEVEAAKSADFTIDARFLALALVGEPSLEALGRAGLVDVAVPCGYESAVRAFGTSSCYCLEFF